MAKQFYNPSKTFFSFNDYLLGKREMELSENELSENEELEYILHREAGLVDDENAQNVWEYENAKQ